jgi:nitrate/nitrite-specific signal transduction histidine kinase
VGMKERAKEIGAELRVTSEPKIGTTIVVDFPVGKMGEGALRRGARQSVKAEL